MNKQRQLINPHCSCLSLRAVCSGCQSCRGNTFSPLQVSLFGPVAPVFGPELIGVMTSVRERRRNQYDGPRCLWCVDALSGLWFREVTTDRKKKMCCSLLRCIFPSLGGLKSSCRLNSWTVCFHTAWDSAQKQKWVEWKISARLHPEKLRVCWLFFTNTNRVKGSADCGWETFRYNTVSVFLFKLIMLL